MCMYLHTDTGTHIHTRVDLAQWPLGIFHLKDKNDPGVDAIQMEAFGVSDLVTFYFASLSHIFLLRLRWLQRSGVSMKLTSLHTYFSSSMCWHCSGMKAYRTNFKVWKQRSFTNQRRDLHVWEWVQWERQSSFLVGNPGLGGVRNGNRRDSRGLGRADVMGRVVWRWPYRLSKVTNIGGAEWVPPVGCGCL